MTTKTRAESATRFTRTGSGSVRGASGFRADLATCKRLLVHTRGYGWHLGGIAILSLLGPACALLYPLPLKVAVDSVLGSQPLPHALGVIVPPSMAASDTALLAVAACLLIGIALLNQAQRAAMSLLSSYTGSRLVLEFRGHIFVHAQSLSLSYHEERGPADSTYRILSDARCVQDVLVDTLGGMFSSCFMFIGLLYVTARLDLALALVALSISPVLLFLAKAYRGPLRRQSRQMKEAESSLMSIAQEALGALRVVRAFAREEHEHERFRQTSSDGARAQLQLTSLARQLSFWVVLTIAAGEALVLFLGIRHVRMGILSLGELLVVMAYLRRLYDPIRDWSRKSASLQVALASAERIFTVLDQAPAIVERDEARPISRAQGRLELRDVSFGYVRGKPVLHGISLDIEPGSSVHIAGASGAGKTTLISLLTRLYDPTAGCILLDGVDLRDYRIADLRNQFTIVPQESLLFSTNVAENIAYANPSASRDEIVRAARAANAHMFITALPDGYDTRVGERGLTLSGGERQRIALARAFLKDAPILILDEPTSSVDAENESDILAAIERLRQGRTTIMIAHRGSSLRRFDQVVRIEGGRLVAAHKAISGHPA